MSFSIGERKLSSGLGAGTGGSVAIGRGPSMFTSTSTFTPAFGGSTLNMDGLPYEQQQAVMACLDPNRSRGLRKADPPVVASVPSDLIVYTKKQRILDCMNLEPPQKSYVQNNSSEEVLLEYVEDFRRQFTQLFPFRPPLLLSPKNEMGIRKFICTTIRPTQLPFQDLTNLQACSMFVADFLDYLPLDVPTSLPDTVPSPSTTVKMRAGECIDYAILLCSLLRGNAYDAYVVVGYAPKRVTVADLSNDSCPYLDNSLDFDVWEDKWWHFDRYTDETQANAKEVLSNSKILGGGIIAKATSEMVQMANSSNSKLGLRRTSSSQEIASRNIRSRAGAGSAGHKMANTIKPSMNNREDGGAVDEEAAGMFGNAGMHGMGSAPTPSPYELGPEDLARLANVTYEVKPSPIHQSEFIERLEYEHKAVDEYKQKDLDDAAAAEAAKLRPKDPLEKSRIHSWVMVRPGRRGVTETVFVEPTTGKIMPVAQSYYIGVESVFNDTNYWVNMQLHDDNSLYSMNEMSFDLEDTTAWEFVLFDERKAGLANATDSFSRVTRSINATSGVGVLTEGRRTIVGKRPIARPIEPGVPSSSMTADISTPLAYMSVPSSGSSAVGLSSGTGSSSSSVTSVFRPDGTEGPLKPGVTSNYGVGGTGSTVESAGHSIVDLPPTWTRRIAIDFQTYLNRFSSKKKKQVFKHCIAYRYCEYNEEEQGLVLRLCLFDPELPLPGFSEFGQGEDLYGDGYATTLMSMENDATTEVRIYKHREDRLLKSVHYRREDRIRNEYGPGRQEGLMEFIQISSKQRIFKFYPKSRSDGMVMRLELDHKVIELYEGCINRLVYRSVAVESDKQNVRGGPANNGHQHAGTGGRSRTVKSATLALARSNELPIRKITEKFERNSLADAEEDVQKRTHYIQDSLIRIDYHKPAGMLTGSVLVIDKDDIRNNRTGINASGNNGGNLATRGNVQGLSSPLASAPANPPNPTMLSSAGMRITGVPQLEFTGKPISVGSGTISRTYEMRVSKNWKAPPAGVRRKQVEKIIEHERALVEEIRDREKRLSEALQRLDQNGVQLIKSLHIQAFQMPDLTPQQLLQQQQQQQQFEALKKQGKPDSKLIDLDDEGDLRYVYVQGGLYSSKSSAERDDDGSGDKADRGKSRDKSKSKGSALDRSILSDPLALFTARWIGNPTRKQAQEAYDNCLAECRERLIERAQTIQAHYDHENQRLNQLQLQLKRSAAIGGDPNTANAQLQQQAEESMFRLTVLRQRLEEHNRTAIQKYAELQKKLEDHPMLQILRQPLGSSQD